VLDKICDLMPHEKYPYDFFMIGIAESYYKLNETEKANQIVKKYSSIMLQKMKYITSLGPRFEGYFDYDFRVNIQTLSELSSLAGNYGQTDLKTSIDNGINLFLGKYSSQK
jgi:hypothetical protein